MISLGDAEQEVSCYDKIIGACNCCSGKCSNNEQPADAFELLNISLNGSGSPEEVEDNVIVNEDPSPSIVKGNITPIQTIY